MNLKLLVKGVLPSMSFVVCARGRARLCVVSFVWVALCFCLTPQPASGSLWRRGGAQETPRVTVTRFVPALSVKGERLYRLSFEYEFAEGTRPFISGLGEVPGKGSLSYLTPLKTLTFTDERGAVLKRVALSVTGTPEGAGSKMPAPEEFPPEGQTYNSGGGLPAEKCNAVLNEFFENGYRPRVEQGVTYYVTAFQNLRGAPQGKVARVAIQLSIPAQGGGPGTFRVQMIVQEQGILSGGPAARVSDQTLAAARDLRNRVADRLSR